MSEYSGMFMRDDLSDTGMVPSPGYPYHSPDIIAHAQANDPQSYFISNYGSNPNQPVQTGGANNFVYTRAKNLSSSALNGWYISLFQASSSYFMTPSIWRNNRLSTFAGNNAVALPPLASGAIGVGSEPFLLSDLSSHDFCMIGMASQGPNPTIPPDFTTYDAYIQWVRTNQNVCGNNLTVRSDFASRQWDRLDSLVNPEGSDVLTAFRTTASSDVPAGTTFGVQCDPLSVNKSQNVNDGRVLAASGMMPAGFNGLVTTFGSLPSGVTEWRGTIQTETYIARESDSAVARFAVDLAALGEHVRAEPLIAGHGGVLVLLGSVGTLFE